MSRLPTPGADAGNWGDILNDFLVQAHNPDGTLKVNSVGTSQIINNAVTNTQLANNSVTSAELANAAVQTTSLADSSVTTAKLVDGSVTSAKIADNAVTNVKLDTAIQTSLANADSASQPGHTHTIADVTNLQTMLDGKQVAGSYVPTSRTVAGHDLTADVVLTAADVGAATAAEGTLAASALQPGQVTSSARRIASNALIITTTRTFCGKFLPPESSRGRMIIRNTGANPITFQFGSSLLAEFNAPSFTGAPIISVGQELVIEGSVYGASVAPGADGTEIRALIYREVMI